MRRRIHSIVVLATALLAAPAPAQQPLSDSVILGILRQRIAERRAVGLVLGVLDGGRARVLAAGTWNGPGTPDVDGNTVFEIGSITKVFTGTLLADMVARGEVALDDPVAKYLPSTVTVPSRNGRQVTLLDLATQSSALPRVPDLKPADGSNPYADYTVEQMYAFLARTTLTRDPGAQYEYSNLGVGLLGHALARRARTSYEAILTERLLSPLGMTDTRITLTPDMQRRFATGHDAGLATARAWDLPTLAGAGALRSTANDMLKWVAANLRPAGTPLARSAPLAQESRRDAAGGMKIGLNWHVVERNGQRIVWHNGQTGGYHAFMGFNPATGANVVVLANAATNIDDIGMHVLDPSLPLTAAPAAPVARTEVTLPPTALARLVGEYQLAPDFSIAVYVKDGVLMAQATGQGAFVLHAESATAFFLTAVDAQLTFDVDATGAVTGLVLHQAGQHTPGRKVK